jgi:hypothetical protein
MVSKKASANYLVSNEQGNYMYIKTDHEENKKGISRYRCYYGINLQWIKLTFWFIKYSNWTSYKNEHCFWHKHKQKQKFDFEQKFLSQIRFLRKKIQFLSKIRFWAKKFDFHSQDFEQNSIFIVKILSSFC